jgi:hypothetical protein
MKIFEDYEKYRWFFTSSKKLVVGGKSAEQNDNLLKELKSQDEDFVVMHTSSPGSPFSIILSDKKKIGADDLEQTAVFTACFSKAWKEKKKTVSVDIFSLSQLRKTKSMKTGSWNVLGKVERKTVTLELVLTKQNNKLRAVPSKITKDFFLKIIPGKIDKTQMLVKLQTEIPESFSEQEFLSALPSGGISIRK